MNTFEGIQHIGEKIFNYLTTQDLLKCRLASKSWKSILDNPIFWLKKLNSVGEHPKEIHNKWLNLIQSAKQCDIPLSKITYCLIIKYCKFIIHSREKWSSKFNVKPSESEWIEVQKFALGLPPIYQALHTNFPDIEVIKLIGESDKTFTDPVECPRNYILYFTGYVLPPKSTSNVIYYTNPLHESIKFGHDLEVLRYLVSKTENIMQALTEGTPITLAVKKDHLEAYKFFVEMMPLQDLNQKIDFALKCGSVEIIKYLVSQTENPTLTYRKILIKQKPIYLAIRSDNLELCKLFTEMSLTEVDNMVFHNQYTAIEMAILFKRVEILKYLVSKSNEPNKTLDDLSKNTPLHQLAFCSCEEFNFTITRCPCVEMLKIILPKITNFDVRNELGNESALQMVLTKYQFRKPRKPNECFEQKIKILAPFSNLNVPDWRGMTALDYAQSNPELNKIFSELNLIS